MHLEASISARTSAEKAERRAGRIGIGIGTGIHWPGLPTRIGPGEHVQVLAAAGPHQRDA